MRFSRLFSGCGLIALAAGGGLATVHAGETKTYKYDALGRLTSKTSTGTVNNNETHSICYDSAGNRVEYVSSNSGAPAQCTPTPTPTPT